MPLDPANQYEISLIIDGNEYKKWVIAIPEDRPYLAFNSDNGRLQRSGSLSGQEVWLVVRQDWEITSQETRVIEELPPIGVSWRDYYAITVDLGSGSLLQLSNLGKKTISVPIANKIMKPRLVGGKEFARSNNFECLIYTEELPSIRLPQPPEGQSSHDWWKRWTISVYQNGNSNPRTINVGDFHHYLSEQNTYYLLPLNIPNLLQGQVGYQKFVVRGPLGYDANLECIIFPDIDFRVFSESLWPRGYKGYSEIEFSWVMPELYDVTFRHSAYKFDETKDLNDGYKCFIGELSNDAIHISGKLYIAGESYDFTKGIRPLRWGWLGLETNGTVDWQSSAVTISVEELERNSNITLVLQIQDEYAAKISGEISLESLSGKSYYTMPFNLGKNRILKFPLARWKDTLYHFELPSYELWVNIFKDGELVTKYCAAKIIRDWKVSNVELLTSDLKGDEFKSCYLCWEENFNIADKVLRVWNVWKPWQAPITFDIKGKSNNVSINLSTDDLTPGIYRFEIDKVDESDDFSEDLEIKQFPNGTNSNVKDFAIKTREWSNYFKELPPTIGGLLEKYQAFSYPYKQVQKLGHPVDNDYFSADEATKIISVCQVLATENGGNDRLLNLLQILKPCLKETNILTILKAIAQWVAEGNMLHIKVITGLGLDLMPKNVDIFSQLEEWESQTLWSFWPALGFLSNLNGSEFSLLYSGMLEYCGKNGTEQFFNRPLKGPFCRGDVTVCKFDLSQCLQKLLSYNCICDYVVPGVPPAIIGDIENANLIAQKNQDELEFMYSLIDPYPDGIFHADFVVKTIFEWLRRIKLQNQEDEINYLVNDYLVWADEKVKHLLDEELVNPDIIKALERRRCRQKGTIPLVNFPYLVGVCALDRRVQSRQPDLILMNDTTRVVLEVSKWCPSLYGHDLCLFEILMNIWL